MKKLNMPCVVVESPYAGDIQKNTEYARRCVKDCLQRGEAPIASHLLLTQPGILDDSKPEERALGIAAGHAWLDRADLVAVYADLGISSGMLAAIEYVTRYGETPIEFRYLEGPKDER